MENGGRGSSGEDVAARLNRQHNYCRQARSGMQSFPRVLSRGWRAATV